MRLMTVRDLYFATVLALVHATAWWGPPAAKEWAGAAIGSVAYRLSSRKRRLSEAALARALAPTLSARERRAIVRGSFRQFWRETFSLVLSRGEWRRLGGVEVTGAEHLRAAIDRGAGAILWESSYFGRRLMAKHVLWHRGFAIRQVHADRHLGGFRNPRDGGSVVRQRILLPLFERHELRALRGIIRIPQSDSLAFTRAIWRALRDGDVVCMASDGLLGQKFHSVPFLGGSRPFATGVISLARSSGASLLPVFCFDDPPGRPRLVIEPPVDLGSRQDKEGVVADALTYYARRLEFYARRYPAQYRNWHAIETLPDRQPFSI
jgi:lauroyl/myristoyl acyltransferase